MLDYKLGWDTIAIPGLLTVLAIADWSAIVRVLSLCRGYFFIMDPDQWSMPGYEETVGTKVSMAAIAHKLTTGACRHTLCINALRLSIDSVLNGVLQ